MFDQQAIKYRKILVLLDILQNEQRLVYQLVKQLATGQ